MEHGLALCPGDHAFMSRAQAEEAVEAGTVEFTGLDAAMREIKSAGVKRVSGKLSAEAREAARAAGLGVGGSTDTKR